MDQDKIDAFRAQQAQDADKQKQQVNHEEVVGSLNNLLLATMVSKDPKMVEVAQNLAALLENIGQASDQFNNSSLHLLPLANQELADSIRELTDKVEEHSNADLEPFLQELTNKVSQAAKVKPVVNVPKQSVSVDTKPLVSAIDEMKQAIKDQQIDIPETDLSKVTKGLTDVKKAIQALRFPASNYVSPFRSSTGKAVQVQLNDDGTLPIGSSGGTEYTEGDTDNSITGPAIMWEDGSDTLRAVSAAKPLPVDLQDTTVAVTQSGTWDEIGINDSGNSITVDNAGLTELAAAINSDKVDVNIASGSSAGTEYTEDAIAVANPVGGALIVVREDGRAGSLTTADGDNVALRGNNLGELYVKHTDAIAVTNAGLTELAAAINSDKLDVNIKSSDVASGGTSAADDADFTDGTTAGTPIMGVYESTPTTVTDGDLGVGSITDDRQLRVKHEDTIAVTQSGTWDEVGINDSGNSITVDNAQLSVVGSGTEATAMRVTIATDSTGVLSVDDNGGTLTVDNAGLTELAGAINASAQMDVNLAANGIGLATSAKQDTIIGHVDGIEGLIGTTNTNTGGAATSLAVMDDWDNGASDGASVSGDVAHDTADAGEPVKIGFKAVALKANPTEVAANDRTNAIADVSGVQFVISGHPHILSQSLQVTDADGAQTDTAIITAGANVAVVVTKVSVMADNANTGDVSVRIGFGTANTPAADAAQVLLFHPGIAPGSGVIEGAGAGILGIGASNEDVRITCEDPAGGSINVIVTYFTTDIA